MQHSFGVVLVSFAFLGLALSGCSSDGGGGSCQAPNMSGSTLGGTGTASISGTGTLPDGIPDGLELQLLLAQGNFAAGVLPSDFANANDRVCGKTFHYAVTGIEAGTYTLTFEVSDPNDDKFTILFHGTAPSSFTVSDGQALTQDTVFQLTAN